MNFVLAEDKAFSLSTCVVTSLQSLPQAYLVDAHVHFRMKSQCIQQQEHPVSARHFPHEYGFNPRERTTVDTENLSSLEVLLIRHETPIFQPSLDGIDQCLTYLGRFATEPHNGRDPSGIADGSILCPHIDARKHVPWEQWCKHHFPRSPHRLILPEQGEEGLDTQLPEVELSLFFLARFRSDYMPTHGRHCSK
jgi:hypothetical protein